MQWTGGGRRVAVEGKARSRGEGAGEENVRLAMPFPRSARCDAECVGGAVGGEKEGVVERVGKSGYEQGQSGDKARTG